MNRHRRPGARRVRALEPSRLWSVGLQAPAFASTVSNGRSHHVFVLRNVTGAIATGLRPKPHHRPYPGPELLNTKRQGRQTASPEGLPGHLPPTRQGGWGNCLSSQNQPAPLRAVHAKLSSRIRASPNKGEVLYGFLTKFSVRPLIQAVQVPKGQRANGNGLKVRVAKPVLA